MQADELVAAAQEMGADVWLAAGTINNASTHCDDSILSRLRSRQDLILCLIMLCAFILAGPIKFARFVACTKGVRRAQLPLRVLEDRSSSSSSSQQVAAAARDGGSCMVVAVWWMQQPRRGAHMIF